MKKLFAWIGSILEDHPIRSLFTTLIIFAVLIAGVAGITLSTGNETLVQTDNSVYRSNEEMSESFGEETIMILYNGEQEDLLEGKTLEKIWSIEKRYQSDDRVFSVVGVPSLLNQMVAFQQEEIVDRVQDLSQGLEEMSVGMIRSGEAIRDQESFDPSQLEANLEQMAMGLLDVSDQLDGLRAMTGNPELEQRISMMAEGIRDSGDGLLEMADRTGQMAEESAGAVDPSSLVEMGNNLAEISQALEIFHEKSSMLTADIPKDSSQIDELLYNENGDLRELFGDVIIDENHILSVLKLDSSLDDQQKQTLIDEVEGQLENQEFQGGITYILSGKPVLDDALKSEMQSNMQLMVISAVVIMLLILSVIFRVKWRILSVFIILISVVATIGLMGWLSVPITMVSMAVFPILIGLGIDYSIQFHNRYEEEKDVKSTVTHIGKAVAVAVIATFLGFISLYASVVPMIQDFGKMLTIGVIISFIGSLFLLMAFLKLRDDYGDVTKPRREKQKALPYSPGRIEKVLKKTTNAVVKFRVLIVVIVLILSGLGFYMDSEIGIESNIESFMPQEMEELEDLRYIRHVVGSTDQVVLYFEDDNLLTEENLQWIGELEAELYENYPDTIVSINSINSLVEQLNIEGNNPELTLVEQIEDLPENRRKMLLNQDHTEGIMILSIDYLPTEELETFIGNLAEEINGAPVDSIAITGNSALDVEMVEGLTSGRVKMTLLGMGLVFGALLIIYRNVFKALVPLIPVGLIIGLSAGSMYLLGINYTPITATLGALILGMGTEMTVMVMERYLEERSRGYEKNKAIVTAVQRIGKAILASGLTTIGGFSVLMLSEFVILKDFGLMTVINIGLALLSTLFVLPALLVLFDKLLIGSEDFTEKERKTV